MANPLEHATRKVLHIRTTPSDRLHSSSPSNRIDALLQSTSLGVEVCGDVYRGLARLCKSDSRRPLAVIVSLTDLTAPEFEFFSLVSRTYPGFKVYVYDGGHAESRVQRVIQLGATGQVTENVIRALAASPAPTADEVEGSSRLTDEARPTDDATPGAPNMAESDRSGADCAAYSEETEEPGGMVRVPWRRREDAPIRKGPSLREPPAPEPAAADGAGSGRVAYEPLLTEEELRALIGDDIASIAPEKRASPDRDEEPGCGEVP